VKIATFNVDNVNKRLENLLAWLEKTKPDIVCLQELKAGPDAFPSSSIRALGYEAVWQGERSWNGVAILARGTQPEETRRGLPGDPDDSHSRYLEAAFGGLIIGCLYLPNGNPAPGPKFDYKLRWFDRLTGYAKTLLESGAPAVLAGHLDTIPAQGNIPGRIADGAVHGVGEFVAPFARTAGQQ